MISNEEMLEFVRKEMENARMLIDEKMDPAQEIYAFVFYLHDFIYESCLS